MSYPDLPHIPEVPAHRVENLSRQQLLDQARAALHAAEGAVHQLENGLDNERKPALVRQVVIECRRSTFVLQKLSSKDERFDDWYEGRRGVLNDDELMRYFKRLRNQIEKQGLPNMMAELFNRQNGVTIADVACGEDRHGIWISGAMRDEFVLDAATISDASALGLRNFRLPDPPRTHCGQPIEDFRLCALAELVIRFLFEEVLEPAEVLFGERGS